MNNIDVRYQELLKDILENGTQKGDRTGTGTISVFGRQIRHKMSEGFPLLTTKKMYFKGIVTELLWFLRGDTNIKYLVDNDCHIWDGDAYKNYERRWETEGKFLSPPVNKFTKEVFINEIKTNPMVAKELGELGPVYGKQWRNWDKWENTFGKGYTQGIDQIATLINDLKSNPDSRRLMVNAWNVGELEQMVLPPCHYGFQVYTRELSLEERVYNPNWGLTIKTGKPFHIRSENSVIDDGINKAIFNACELNKIPKRAISLMWNQRSVDTFLGLPFNIASYGLLLEIIAKVVNMVPDELIGNLGDVHLYSNHIEQAKEQIGREMSVAERMEYYGKHFMKETETKTFDELLKINYDELNVPTRTREPYPLPNLVFGKTDEFFRELGNDLRLITHLDNTDFKIENYQSHPTIKAPLSN